MNNFISTIHSKSIQIFICLFLSITWGNMNAQVVPVNNPNGGFEIDGDLESNGPTSGAGDWVEGNAGSGGFVFEDDGDPLSISTKLVRDEYNVITDDRFVIGSTINDDPNSWVWEQDFSIGTADMHNGFYHLGIDSSNQEWAFAGSDRFMTNGTTYTDFEFYQNTIVTNRSNDFTSSGPDGGRTVNDILVTVEYGGGTPETVYFYLWEDIGGGNFQYVLQASNPANAFAKMNTSTVNVPFRGFTEREYAPGHFVEVAVNLSSVFGTIPNPCLGINIKTILIKTRESNLASASLLDFTDPMQVDITFGLAEIVYLDSPACQDDPPLVVTQTGVTGGTYSAVPTGLSIDPTSGEIDVQNSLPGTYTVTYSYVTNGCPKIATTTVTIYEAPLAPVSGGDQTECEENPIQTLTATASVPGGQTIVWYDMAAGGNIVANPILNTVGTITYYAESTATVNGCTSLSRTPVTLTILANPFAPISGGDQIECEEDPIQTLTATATVPGGQTVVWYDMATGGTVIANPILNTVGTITYYAESVLVVGGCASASRTAVTLTITAAAAAPISTGDITECLEDPIQTLDANNAITPTTGQTVVWYDMATGGTVVVSPTLNTIGTIIYYAEGVLDGTSCVSLTRTSVTLTITPAATAPISTGDITECEEDPIQTLDANDAITPTTGQTVVWYDAATAGNVVASPTLSIVGTVTYWAEGVVDGTDCVSLTRTSVTLTIEPAATAPISTGDITECEEDPIQTLDANNAITPTTGQTVVWYDMAAGGAVVANPILNAIGTITYYAEGVLNGTNCISLTRTAVTLTITPAADAPTSTGDLTECEEDPIQTLDANDAITPTTGQTVVWYDMATGGTVVANPTLSTVGTVTYWAEGVVDGTDCVSLTRTSVTLTIEPAATAPISTGDITECEEDPIQTLDANNAITPTTGQTVVWYDMATGGTVVASPTLSTIGTITYYAEGVLDGTDCVSLTRTSVTLTIEPAATAPISTGDITECEEDPIQTLDANDAITPTTGQTVVWYDAATAGNVVASPTLSTVGTVTYWAEGLVDGTDCVSLTRTSVTLTIEPAADAPISSGDITECLEDPIQTLDANDAITPTTGQTVVWYDMATGGTVVASPTLITLGTVTYWAEGLVDGTDCVSLSRTSVTLTITDAADAPISSGDITECEEDPIQTLDANDAITPTTGQTVVWYDAATGGTVVASPILNTVGTVTYWAEGLVDGTDCISLTRTAVTLTITPQADAPISTGDITECEEDPIQTLDANDAITPTTGQTVVWYDAATGGTVVASPTLNTVGTVTYYAEGVLDGTDCVSLTRTAVTLTITPAATAPISTGDITECEEDPIQTLDANNAITPTTGQTVVWYDAATGGAVVASPTLNTLGTATYWAQGLVDGTDCNSLTRTSVTLTIESAADAPISTGDISECEENPIQTLNANDAITPTTGQTVVWYDAVSGGTVVSSPILNTVGTVTYWAEGLTDGTLCASQSRTAVTLTITPAADAPISSGDIIECQEPPQDPIQTLDANDAITLTTGQTIVWYDAATGGNVVTNPVLVGVGTVTYWAEASVDGTDCVSLSRTSVTLTITPAADAPISTGDISECEANPIQTLDANDAITPTTGQTVVWYDAVTAGNIVSNPTLNTIGIITYYAEGVLDGTSCESLTRTAVTLSISNVPVAPISSGDQVACVADPIQILTASASVASGQTIVWYDALTGGNVVASPTLAAIGTVTYYAEAVVNIGSCVSSTRTPVQLKMDTCSISLTKSGLFNDENGDLITQIGETVSYVFSVTNTGGLALTNIELTDALPGVVISGGPISSLAPGSTEDLVFTASYAVTQDDCDALEVVNQAVITGVGPDGSIVSDESDDPNNFTDIDNNGDGEPDDPTVVALLVVKSVTFDIFNAVTPNGDGKHDYFRVLGIENWPDNMMQIYNRWGVLVYEAEGYGGSNGEENVFRAISEGRVTVRESAELSTGTYYYVLKFSGDNPGKSGYAGYLYINR